MLDLIPVIDLLRGQVVRAVRGDRQSYRPIESALCRSSEPLTVARMLCEYAAARTLYLADLDALQGGAAQIDTLVALLHAIPDVELWLDAGFADAASADRVLARLGPRVTPVFASESLRSLDALPADALLSLDRRDGIKLDPTGCWDAPERWPDRVIVMTLERVGSAAGPDLDTLRELHRHTPATRFIGAGGIACEADLQRAAEAGASAWLVASALHDLRLARRT